MALVDDLLEALRLRGTVFSRMVLAGEWGFAKEALQGAPFHLVLSGAAVLERTGEPPRTLGPGDLVVVPSGEAHRLLSRPGAPTVPWGSIADELGLAPWRPGQRFKALELRFGAGSPATTLISGVFAFADRRRNPLFDALPAVLHLRAGDDGPAARTAAAMVALLDAELQARDPGAESVSARIADILFVQVVRHHLASSALPAGWLRGIADPEIAPALALMQNAPGEAWSVERLARAVGMSRSRFAARFGEVVGQAPLAYLTGWRMYLAAGRLAESGDALKTLAGEVGYASDVAFAKAFRKWSGRSPTAYRRWLGEAHRDDG